MDEQTVTTNEPPTSDGNAETDDCETCNLSVCSQWELAYSIRAGSPKGDIKCFTKSVANGALVRISYKLHAGGPLYTRSPIQYTYESASSDINFYFAPFFEMGSVKMKSYVGLSSSGYFNQASYSMWGYSSSATTAKSPVEEVHFYTLKPDCNVWGDPGNYVRQVTGLMDGLTGMDVNKLNEDVFKLSSLDMVFNQGGTYTVHAKENQDYTEVFQANWVIFEAVGNRIAAIKPRGEHYKDKASSNLRVGDPLESEYQIINANGVKTSQRVGHDTSNPLSVLEYSTMASQVWFTDNCWAEVYTNDKLSNSPYDKIDDLKRSLLNGYPLRIVFKSGGLTYSTSALGVYCNTVICGALVESLPELNTAGMINFKAHSGDTSHYTLKTYQFYGSKLYTGNLSSSSFMDQQISTTWYVDVRNYVEIFRHSPAGLEYDDLDRYIRNGSPLRLSYVYNDIHAHYDIESVVVVAKNSFELHTAHTSDRFLVSETCYDGRKPINYGIVLKNKPSTSLKRYGWTWDYTAECYDQNVQYDLLFVHTLAGDR